MKNLEAAGFALSMLAVGCAGEENKKTLTWLFRYSVRKRLENKRWL